jgi:hypothetical protein
MGPWLHGAVPQVFGKKADLANLACSTNFEGCLLVSCLHVIAYTLYKFHVHVNTKVLCIYS